MAMQGYSLKNYYKVKARGKYPWPFAGDPNRTIELYPDDVLTKDEDGTYTVHTGICRFRIVLADDEVEFCPDRVHLEGV